MKIFEWNFQQTFLIKFHEKWIQIGWAWPLFDTYHTHFSKTLLFRKWPLKPNKSWKFKKGDGLFESPTYRWGAFRHYLADLDKTRTVVSLGDFKMALGVKFAFFTFLGGSGGTPGVAARGKIKMLNFELLRQVRGQNASFLGADFSRAFKTMIFGLLGGQGPFGGPP